MDNKISIIVPAYNIESCLSATLDSVLSQTYKNIEVIVVNDGSTDETGSIIDYYANRDSRVKAIHKENGGVTSARLRGVSEATGEWIGFVDGDDYIESRMYERLLCNALEHGADISHCGYQMVLPSGKILYYYNSGKMFCQDCHTGLKDLLENCVVEPGLWNKLYARRLLDDFIRMVDFDCTIRINEDLLMNFYLFRMADISVFEDVCPYHYVVRKESAANAKLNANQLLHPLRVKKILFQETEHDDELHRICGNHLVRHLVMLATMNPKQDPALIRPIQKKARHELRQMIRSIWRKGPYSNKIRILALWAALLPTSYRWIHDLYSIVVGTYNIYEK